ncbi:hypothetical protein OHT93_38700 [Streptomyces sp. NBC_00191]|uniref:hypothetical protein n=1 Tax=Streptomyces sp. NBC_00191 TaxID=2975674 RepID=UPI00324D278A
MQERQTTKHVLLTEGPDMAGIGYRHLLMPVRLDVAAKYCTAWLESSSCRAHLRWCGRMSGARAAPGWH